MSNSSDSGIIVRVAGGPETLEWSELTTGAPARGEVRIEQRAVGVNFIDTYFRKGAYPWPMTPLIPGSEAAGVVEQVGEGVSEFGPGDRVAYTLPIGAYRTRRVVPAERLVKLPDGIGFDVAASLMLKGLTTQFLLTSCYAVKPGDVVLVHAAAGGVGLLMGQWLKSIGATAIGTAGSAEKTALARANGYTHVIDYRKQDFAARVKELTGGSGCDVVYDSVANDTWRGSLKCLRPRGLFVCFGQSSGSIVDFKISDLAAGGSLYATRPMLFDYIKTRADLTARAAELFSMLESGALKPHIGQRIALRDAAHAHRELEARKTTGSTILLP
ncbi:MAG TPA: quinone oxidoreductase [Steroidobacteraceae bacterium]|jgi:NADPH2:quinone reductase|nr:quinone oxidoreductase [Steroidobacteraceae bacterium]